MKGGISFTKQFPNINFPFVLPALKHYFHIYEYSQTQGVKKEEAFKGNTQTQQH